jgi:Protein of unknown function (DUF3313)
MIQSTRIYAALTLAILAAGCATTQQTKVTDGNYCPFLGSAVCAELVTAQAPSRFGSGGPTAYLHYIDSSAKWTSYKSIMLQPVTFWADDTTKISTKEEHHLTNYFYQALEKQLGTKFQMVTEPGPGVMRVQVALEDATAATPVLRTISMVIPQARALATLKFLATGSYPFVGGAQAEAKITDSETGVVLAAAVDRRIGGGALGTAAQWQYGDAENAVNAWAQQMTERLGAWTSGTATP